MSERESQGPGERGPEAPGAQRETRVLPAALRDPIPVIVILSLAGIFDGISGNPIHSILLLVAAAALTRDAVRRRAAPAAPPRTAPELRLTPTITLAGIAFALVVGAFPRYTWQPTMAIALLGAAAIAVSWQGPLLTRPEPPAIEPFGAITWASVFIALGLWELAALLLQPSLTTDSYAHPTISFITDPVLASHAGRSILIALWLALGWFVIER